MKAKKIVLGWILSSLVLLCSPLRGGVESAAVRDARMKWWREARFGLFIHWGLYAVPAGEWGGKTNYGEWVRHTAKIPISEYERFVKQFNPVKFDADRWVAMAKAAGMKYIVITSKHHDGFCLFDSKETDFDIMSTPFQRDVLNELAAACKKAGIILCFYHSIMDWHHPDYLPRRDWEKDRPVTGADFNRYVQYMKNQLKELLGNYGPIGVLWFDGEWENTWNSTYGNDLYDYVRGLQPEIIVNNRVGAKRSGMEGFSPMGQESGDFGTPEQQVPATGLPGVDWETCMTMNDNWGYNKNDQNWKSGRDLIRLLVDVASKGGNLLLNVGPTAEGLFPQASVERLQYIGKWMEINGESIYGTRASPFKVQRCTQRRVEDGTILYLHVFDWPADGKLVVPGLISDPLAAYLLFDRQKKPLDLSRSEDELHVALPKEPPDPDVSVVVLEILGDADVCHSPAIEAEYPIFIDKIPVHVRSDRTDVEVRYSLGDKPLSAESPLAPREIWIDRDHILSARCFRAGKPVSAPNRMFFSRVLPRPALGDVRCRPGLTYEYFLGDWELVPDFRKLKPRRTGKIENFTIPPECRPEHFALNFQGLIKIPTQGIYSFHVTSDDGTRLYIDDQWVMDNDGLHGPKEVNSRAVPLAAGLHTISLAFFQKEGGRELSVSLHGPGLAKQIVPSSWLFHRID